MQLRWLLPPLLAACASTDVQQMPARLTALPSIADAQVYEAQRAHDRGDYDRAGDVIDRLLEVDPTRVDAHRLRQDLLLSRGRRGLVLAEAERRLVEWNGSAPALYLRGRVAESSADKSVWFRRAVAADPSCFWAWFGLAFTLRDGEPEQAIAIYRRLLRASESDLRVSIALASVLRSTGATEEALAIYDGLTRDERSLPGIGELGRAETLFEAERRSEAWPPTLRALQLRPFDPAVQRLLRVHLESGLHQRRVREALDALHDRMEEFIQRGGGPVVAELYRKIGLNAAALSALAGGRDKILTAEERRRVRELQLQNGFVGRYLESLRASIPRSILDDERNQVRLRWVALFSGPWAGSSSPLERVDRVPGLARAMVRVGLLQEAATVVDLALNEHDDISPQIVEQLLAIQLEARREAVFEAELGRLLYRSYPSPEPAELSEVLDGIRRLSRRTFGRDVVGEPQLFEVPMVGEMIDPFAAGDHLARHLAKYNKHIVLGQRAGGPVEGLLFTRVSLRYLEPDPRLSLPGRCWQVIGDQRQIQTRHGLLGGDLAGIALLNHYVIDLDAVRDWAGSLQRRRQIAAADDRAILRDPLPTDVRPTDPVDVHWRLALMSPVEDSALEAAVLDTIFHHERAHLVDSFRYLPPENNLWRVLGLLFDHGFDPARIEGEMEQRAELAALAYSPHTELVLAHIASFCRVVDAGSPHGYGFKQLAEDINVALAADPVYSNDARVSRWHLVPMERFREIARSLADEAW